MSPFTCNHDGSCEEVRLCCFETEMTVTREDVKRIRDRLQAKGLLEQN